jgi:hypothetical protein
LASKIVIKVQGIRSREQMTAFNGRYIQSDGETNVDISHFSACFTKLSSP